MAKMKRNQDDKDLLIRMQQLMESLGTDGLKPTSKVSKDISDLVEKELGKGKGKPRAFNNGGAVMSGRGPKFKGIK
mgnify:CR=1 FL=1|tara:strand:- start:72 stop:299 length:228 start_codon:yes stop_codon:yes gene_type:complete